MAKSPSNGARAMRARHTKSRNGCLTCKIRRIRCDETLPSCHNCQSTGRQCEGPKDEKFTFVRGHQTSCRRQSPNSSSGSSPDATQLQICSSIPACTNHDADEYRSFDFFVNRTAPLFAAGALNSAFWRKLVPRISHSDPVVWNAVITIATLMEHPIGRLHVVRRIGTGRATKPQQLQALWWYSRAVSGARERIKDGNAMASALLNCILFACIENQQGNMNNAFNLVQHGVKLFADYLKIAPKDRPEGYRILDEIVIPFFSQHAIFLATFGLPLLSQAAQAAELAPPAISPEKKPESNSPEDLKLQLYRIMFLAHELIRAAALIIENTEELSTFKPRQISILAELQQWRAKFDARMKQDLATRAEWACSFLMMHYHVTYIWVSKALSVEESSADEHTERFREIISHAQKYLLLRPAKGEDASLFEFGAEAIPPLYFTVTKCRHPEIRRRALSLIDQLPKTDTIWATLPVVAMLENVIAFEEKNSAGTDISFPAEEDRVHHVKLVKTPASPEIAANFVTFAKEGDGRRTMKEHFVDLNDCQQKTCNGARASHPSYTRLPGDATSLRLAMAPDFFEMLSPSEILPQAPQAIEGVV